MDNKDEEKRLADSSPNVFRHRIVLWLVIVAVVVAFVRNLDKLFG